MNNLKDFASIDFEIANVNRSSVCSVGVAIVKDRKIVDTFYSLIKPRPNYYYWKFTEIHGLKKRDTMSAHIFPDVWAEIAPKLQGLPLVAHIQTEAEWNYQKKQYHHLRNAMKYLVDLNYTLVGNSPKWNEPKLSPFIRQIEQETYREWLVDFLRDKETILITARPNRYTDITLERIKALTGWQPQDAYFGEISATPPEIKEHLLQRYIFPKYGKGDYFGIESNPKTRDMYVKYSIKSLKFDDFKKQTLTYLS